QYPVEQVSWHDAAEFCRQLSILEAEQHAGRTYRLPTEAEWEYAARAGTATPFFWGDRLSATRATFDWSRPYGVAANNAAALGHPTAVGSYRTPPHPFGLHDLHGNVWEWCQDWYDDRYYESGPDADPPGPEEGTERVLRGG